MKHALLAASLVLIGGGAVACGGDGAGGGAPTDASKTEFCDAYSSLFTDLAALGTDGGTPDEAAMVEGVKAWAKKMREVGTPEGISDEVRQGFELTIDEAEDLDAEDFSAESLGDLNADLDADEKAQAEAFSTYLTDECGNPLEELMPSEPAS